MSFDSSGGVSTASVNAGPLNNLNSAGQIPLRFRQSRAGCKVMNYSRSDSINGLVKCVSLSQPLLYDWVNNLSASVTSTFVSEIENIMTNHVDVVEYTAHDFTSPKEFVLAPNSIVDYNSWKKWNANSTAVDIQAQFESSINESNPFNVLIIEWSATTTQQTWNIDTRLQACLKFSGDDIISHFSVDGAIISSEMMADIKKHLSSQGMEFGAYKRRAYLTKIPTTGDQVLTGAALT